MQITHIPLDDIDALALVRDRATLDPDELRYAVETVAATAESVRAALEPTAASSAPTTSARFAASITVPLPPGWFAKESFTVLAPDGQANVIASSEPLDPSIDTARYAEVQRGLLEKEFPDYHEIGSGEITLAGGVAAQWREFGWQPPDGVRVMPGNAQALDTIPAMLSPGEVVLPTIGGRAPGDLLAGLTQLGKDLSMVLARAFVPQGPAFAGAAAGPVTYNIQAMDAASIRTMVRRGDLRDESVLAQDPARD